MKETKSLGTVLPLKKDIQRGNKFYRDLQRKKRAVAAKLKGTIRTEDTAFETLYWQSETVYAVVGGDLKVKRFERRSDGDYSIK